MEGKLLLLLLLQLRSCPAVEGEAWRGCVGQPSRQPPIVGALVATLWRWGRGQVELGEGLACPRVSSCPTEEGSNVEAPVAV